MNRTALLWLALLLISGCQKPTQSETAAPEEPRPKARAAAPQRLAELTGLYSAEGDNRLCISGPRFGFVLGGPGAGRCSGSGRVTREDRGIRFAMDGDSVCSFTVRVERASLLFPASLPAGCVYYCAAGARMDGVRLTQVENGREAAGSAKDLAGEPLCDD